MAVQLTKSSLLQFIKKGGGYGAAALAGYQLNDVVDGVKPETPQQQPINIITNENTHNYNKTIIILLWALIIIIIFILLAIGVKKIFKKRETSGPAENDNIS